MKYHMNYRQSHSREISTEPTDNIIIGNLLERKDGKN